LIQDLVLQKNGIAGQAHNDVKVKDSYQQVVAQNDDKVKDSIKRVKSTMMLRSKTLFKNS